jgi:hypothetical protein
MSSAAPARTQSSPCPPHRPLGHHPPTQTQPPNQPIPIKQVIAVARPTTTNSSHQPPPHRSGATKHLDWWALFISIGVVISAVGCGLAVSSYASPLVRTIP